MPAKGKSKVSEEQKAAMAIGRAKGVPSHQVADQLGLHPSTVRQYWGGHDTLVAQCKYDRARELRKLFGETITAVGASLRQKKDKRLQLHAGAMALRLITAGDPPLERVVAPPPPPPEGELIHTTLEELLISYRRATIQREGGDK